jgi:hypothetical protein
MNDQDLTKTDYDPDRSLALIEGLSHFLTNFLQNLASCQTSFKRGCKCKNVDAYETNAQFCRILVIPFRRSAGDIFEVYLTNLTNTYKVKDNIWT